MLEEKNNIISITSGIDEFELDAEIKALIEKTINVTLACEDFEEVAEVAVAIVSAEEIRELNHLHRNKDSVTDVLSFVQYDDDGFVAFEDEAVFIGDIVLCYQRAEEQAIEYGHSLARELSYLTCHSVLHLLGYDHMTESEKAEMRAREKLVMQKLDLER